MAAKVECGVPTIAEFYSGKNIFLTGGTGFIGKVFIEKVLRSCTDVGDIYILIRPRRGKSVRDRMRKIFTEKIFDRLRKENPDFELKIKPVEGDMMKPNLGISQTDAEQLSNKIHLVFHSAATIKFDEPIRVAVEMNMLAVRKMIKLSKTFNKLELFLHVSTAYSNCDRHHIEEILYPAPIEPQQLINLCSVLDDESLSKITPKLLGDKPNTYTYTKHLAEHLLMKEGKELPLAIVRPSIVTSSWKEPFPGWIDNYNGPSGLYIAMGNGMLRAFHAEPGATADIIPVDIVVNTLITTAWYTVINKPEEVPIVHCTSGGINPITWREVADTVLCYYRNMPLQQTFRQPASDILCKNKMLRDFWVIMSHHIPAYMTDVGLRLTGSKPYMVNRYTKLHKAVDTMNFFVLRSWVWTNANSKLVNNKLTTEDKEAYHMCPGSLSWPEYVEDHAVGMKKYVMNEPVDVLPSPSGHQTKMRNLGYTINTIMVIAIGRILVAQSEMASSVWQCVASCGRGIAETICEGVYNITSGRLQAAAHT